MSTITIQIPARQLEVLDYLASGYTKKEIAHKMNCSFKNIERIVYSMIVQFECKNSTELVAYMVSSGVICYKRA
jgi:DNA-binding NarL/FixJ family response regulator